MNSGYRLAPEELAAQVSALGKLGETTSGLVSSAGRLAERLPQLGTAPPALHLAARLREAAGQTGLTGEISGANSELNTVHTALRDSVAEYLHAEQQVADALRAAEGSAG
ncbi:MAG TPA: hypothetical protein VG247_03900 [Pseudonocardiaceae bacterium]|nr:hypothetical protein [Pseudonocardiaceae bacterium]